MAAEAVTELDFINARAIFHQNFNCVIPEIQADQARASGKLELTEARHPLLEENLRASAGAVALLGVATIAVTLSNFYGGLIAAVITPIAVGGYWLNIPGPGAQCPTCGPPNPGIALEFLRKLGG